MDIDCEENFLEENNERVQNYLDNNTNIKKKEIPNTNQQKNFFKNKLKSLKEEYLKNKKLQKPENISKSNIEIFRKLNQNALLLNRRYKLKTDLNEISKVTEFQNRHELIKDIFLINSNIRCSSYNEQLKMQKKICVRNLSNEIDSYRVKLEQFENMPNLLKVNLFYLSGFLNKLKPLQSGNSSSGNVNINGNGNGNGNMNVNVGN